MTKHPFIFDWSKAEVNRRDMLFSIIIMGLLFVFIIGSIELNLSAQRRDSDVGGTLIRLVDDDMAKFWALTAQENGPFPGRLETERKYEGLMFDNNQALGWWTDYKVSLRPMRGVSGVVRSNITTKGKREFPVIPAREANTPDDVRRAASLPGDPILVPYDKIAIKWLPKDLPDFDYPLGTGGLADSLRFLVSLREDGSVAELIPLAGAPDPLHAALESWLRGIRFKQGDGERWFGLRIDFENNRNNESDPE